MKEKYKVLLKKILTEIDEIDREVSWSESEPKWWLGMISLRRYVSEELSQIR